MSLSVSRLVRVVVNLSPIAAARRSFGILNIAGDSSVISGAERIRSYDSIEGVAADFGLNAPEYKAAALYFGQSPKPKSLNISRWLRTASAAQNLGGILTTAQKAISNWNVISSGGFSIVIDGVTKNLSGLDFSAQSNLNGVATVINNALTGGTVVWDGSKFVVTSSTTGAGVKATGTITLDTNPSPGVRATNTIQLTANPSNGNTVTIQGTLVTFVTGAPGAGQVQIGVDAATTLANLLAYLQASADANLALMTYSYLSDTITATARLYGTAGNAYTLAKSGTNITIGGATFSGGVAADTLTVNGTAITFVAAIPTGNQVLVGATAALTSANLQGFLQASVDSNIAQATYATASQVTTVTFKAAGTGGNAFTLTKSSSHITLSGAVLSGGTTPSSVGYATSPGSGTDISTMLRLTGATSLQLIAGYDAETPAECAAVLANKSAAWYGLMFQASVQPTNDQSLAVSDLIEALDIKRIYGVTISDTSVLSSLQSNDLASLMKAGGYRQSFCHYSQNVYAVASMFGRAFSVDFNANRSTITLMYKQEPSVAAEELTATEADTLKDKRCNVFVNYVNDTSIIQYGTMSGSAYFDEVHGLDWFQDAVQNACYNLLYQSPTKIPQTDAGANQFVSVIAGVCDEAVNNGLVAPGQWNADGFGELSFGQYLKAGYYIYAQPIALQSQADRETRVAPPIQTAIKLAGAIQGLDVIINVNR